MNCLEFRQLRLADPYGGYKHADTHRDDCEACAAFEQEIATLDASLNQALSVAVPEGLAARIMLNHSLQEKPHRSTRWLRLGVAASFLLALTFGIYQITETPALAAPLLAHAGHQAHEFYGTEHQPISTENIARIMAQFGVEADLDDVVYAAICPLQGEGAIHLVIRDAGDQYTVMLMPKESPGKSFSVSDELWRGYISPHPAGAIAVLAAVDDASARERLPEVKDKLQQQIHLAAQR